MAEQQLPLAEAGADQTAPEENDELLLDRWLEVVTDLAKDPGIHELCKGIIDGNQAAIAERLQNEVTLENLACDSLEREAEHDEEEFEASHAEYLVAGLVDFSLDKWNLDDGETVRDVDCDFFEPCILEDDAEYEVSDKASEASAEDCVSVVSLGWGDEDCDIDEDDAAGTLADALTWDAIVSADRQQFAEETAVDIVEAALVLNAVQKESMLPAASSLPPCTSSAFQRRLFPAPRGAPVPAEPFPMDCMDVSGPVAPKEVPEKDIESYFAPVASTGPPEEEIDSYFAALDDGEASSHRLSVAAEAQLLESAIAAYAAMRGAAQLEAARMIQFHWRRYTETKSTEESFPCLLHPSICGCSRCKVDQVPPQTPAPVPAAPSEVQELQAPQTSFKVPMPPPSAGPRPCGGRPSAGGPGARRPAPRVVVPAPELAVAPTMSPTAPPTPKRSRPLTSRRLNDNAAEAPAPSPPLSPKKPGNPRVHAAAPTGPRPAAGRPASGVQSFNQHQASVPDAVPAPACFNMESDDDMANAPTAHKRCSSIVNTYQALGGAEIHTINSDSEETPSVAPPTPRPTTPRSSIPRAQRVSISEVYRMADAEAPRASPRQGGTSTPRGRATPRKSWVPPASPMDVSSKSLDRSAMELDLDLLLVNPPPAVVTRRASLGQGLLPNLPSRPTSSLDSITSSMRMTQGITANQADASKPMTPRRARKSVY